MTCCQEETLARHRTTHAKIFHSLPPFQMRKNPFITEYDVFCSGKVPAEAENVDLHPGRKQATGP